MKGLFPILIGTALVIMSGCTEENLPVDQSNNEVSAHHIPVEKAKQRLLRIASELNSETGTRADGGIAGTDRPITSVTTLGKDQQRLTRGDESEAAYYVFRFGDNEGFAIMAADDRLPEMMAIASGTPNQDDPTADLPDTTFWQVPGIGDINGGLDSAINTQNPDIHEPNEPGRPYTKLYQTDKILVHWGQRAPFNALLEFSHPDSIELRPPTPAVAVAQVLTRKEFRNTHVLNYRINSYPYNSYTDTVNFNQLCRCRYDWDFEDRPDMALMVAKLFRSFQSEHSLDLHFGYYGFDAVNNVYYWEGYLPVPCTSEDSNDFIGRTLRSLGLQCENSKTSFTINYAMQGSFYSKVYQLLRGGNTIIVGGWDFDEDAYIVHNAMSYDDAPATTYFLVNNCRGGNGDGYYLATGCTQRVFFTVSKSN